jgi:sortase A
MKSFRQHVPSRLADGDSSQHGVSARARRWLKIGQYLFLLVAALFLGRTALSYGRLRIVQLYESWQFDHDVPQRSDSVAPKVYGQLPQATPPLPRVEAGELLGRLEIPRLGISAMVLEGDDDDILAKAAGHVPSTALPGEIGNFVIAAHRDTLFRGLKNIRKDDTITFSTPAGTHDYRVESLEKVSPNDVEVLKASAQPTLTLITCYPFNFIGHAPLRFVVKAAEIDAAPEAGSEVLAEIPEPTVESAPEETTVLKSAVGPLSPRLAVLRSARDEAEVRSSFIKNSQRERPALAINSSPKQRSSGDQELQATNTASVFSTPVPYSPSRATATQRSITPKLDAANSSPDNDEHADATPARAPGKLSKVRAWLGGISAHFRKGHAETPAED